MPTHPEQTNTCFRFELFISLIEIENRCERSLEMLKATHHTLSIIIAVLKFITICDADLLINVAKIPRCKIFLCKLRSTYKNFIISYAFVSTFSDTLPNTLKL